MKAEAVRAWNRMGRRRSALWACLILGAAMRVPGIFTDLWFDEVWSLENVRSLRSWTDIFTSLKTDNNHHLNSLFLLWLGPSLAAPLYRLLALVCGSASVIVAWSIGMRANRTTALVHALVIGLSYLLVHYGSEARGYGPLIFLTLLGWWLLLLYADHPSLRRAIPFWLCCALGVLAHQTYVLFIIGAYVWCDVHLQRRQSVRTATRDAWLAFAVPVAWTAVFYWVSLRGVTVAGGPDYSIARVVVRTLSLLWSGPGAGPGMWVVAFGVSAVFLVSLAGFIRRKDDSWVFFVLTIVVLPSVFVGLTSAGVLAPRYFTVPGTLLLLVVSGFIAEAIGARWPRAGLGYLALSVLAIGCALHVAELSSKGRGRYSDAVRYLRDHSGGATVTVGAAPPGASDFRLQLMIDHSRRLAWPEGQIRYLGADHEPHESPDWIVSETVVRGPTDRSTIVVGHQHYVYAATFDAAPLSGITWHLYHRTE